MNPLLSGVVTFTSGKLPQSLKGKGATVELPTDPDVDEAPCGDRRDGEGTVHREARHEHKGIVELHVQLGLTPSG